MMWTATYRGIDTMPGWSVKDSISRISASTLTEAIAKAQKYCPRNWILLIVTRDGEEREVMKPTPVHIHHWMENDELWEFLTVQYGLLRSISGMLTPDQLQLIAPIYKAIEAVKRKL